MEGLKKLIYTAIHKTGYLSVDRVNEICDNNGYKRSNAERRLRRSESHSIIPIKNAKHYIIGYRLVDSEISQETPPITRVNEKKDISPVQDTLFPLSEITNKINFD